MMLAKQILKEIPADVSVPAFCFRSKKTAEGFKLGFQAASNEDYQIQESTMAGLGIMGQKAYLMGVSAAKSHFHRVTR
jgi:hypothetical protein